MSAPERFLCDEDGIPVDDDDGGEGAQEAQMEAELGCPIGAWSHPESFGTVSSRAFRDNETERERTGGA